MRRCRSVQGMEEAMFQRLAAEVRAPCAPRALWLERPDKRLAAETTRARWRRWPAEHPRRSGAPPWSGSMKGSLLGRSWRRRQGLRREVSAGGNRGSPEFRGTEGTVSRAPGWGDREPAGPSGPVAERFALCWITSRGRGRIRKRFSNWWLINLAARLCRRSSALV